MAIFIENFHWLRPWWLLALVPVLVFAGILWRRHSSSQQWQKHIAPSLLPTLLDGGIAGKSSLILSAIVLCWLLICIALAGPVWQQRPSPVVQNTDALVICWDLSPSMLAEDVNPSRLIRSRLKIIDLLKSRPDGQTALIAFSGEAYTVTPLTDDIQTIINLLPALAPNTLPTLGSNPEMAYRQAAELLTQAGISQGQILMLTDEITSDALTTLEGMVAATPHTFVLWGIGTASGAPVPWGKQGFARDKSGAIALAKLNEQELRSFAVKTNSYYLPVVNDSSDIDALQNVLSGNAGNSESQTTERLFDQWLEQGHWLVWVCLGLMFFGFRRGWLLVAVLAVPTSLMPDPAQANPFKTDDQTGYDAYQQQTYDKAAEHFDNPNWQGAAKYRLGDYAGAAAAFSAQQDAQGKFNRGNAELLQGQFEQAINSYEEALKLAPNNADAIDKNLQLAKQLKQQQEEQKKQEDKQNQDKENQDSEKQDKDEQQASDQEKSEDQNQQNNQPSESEQNEPASAEQNPASQASAGGASSSAPDQSADHGSATSAASSMAATNDQSQSSDATATSASAANAEAQLEEDPPQTEEQQKLDTILRKVPDDPAGLLRAKFQHQYRERQQQLRQGSDFDETKKAEQRW
jgi:Ca-activated chloride channel family protein